MTFIFDNLERHWRGEAVQNLVELGRPHQAA
jgi:hypothetical protein